MAEHTVRASARGGQHPARPSNPRKLSDAQFALLHTATAPSGASEARPASRLIPPDVMPQPITEGQFAAVVRGYDAAAQEDGSTVYTRDAYPWRFTRVGNEVAVEHRLYDLPAAYYTIVPY